MTPTTRSLEIQSISMAKGAAICALVVLVVAQVTAERAHAIDCFAVDTALRGCVPYLTGQADVPAAGCCSGIQSIKNMAKTTADRQAACSCMKAAASRLPGLKDEAVEELPSKCNVPLPYPISVSVDCSKIQSGVKGSQKAV